jgi:polysaccharide export outer membrane protein
MLNRFDMHKSYPSLSLTFLLLWAIALPSWAQSTPAPNPSPLPPSPSLAPLPRSSQPLNVELQETQGATKPSYLLGPGDQVQITVLGYDEYTGTRIILPDGTITLPVVGAVQAADRTPEEFSRELTQQLSQYLVNPAVTVSLSTLRPVAVNVSGEVYRPGPVQLRSLTTVNDLSGDRGSNVRTALDGLPTISSALMQAGGITANADIRKIVLRRNLPGGNSTSITIDLWDAIWSQNVPQDLILQPGDSVYVPRLAEGDSLDRRLLARSSLSPRSIRVRVVGDVKAPGQIEVPPESTISGAIAIAGGPLRSGTLRRVELIRLSQNGAVTSQTLDLRQLNDSDQIQDGDVVFVPEQNESAFLRVLGGVVGPVSGVIGILGRLFGF